MPRKVGALDRADRRRGVIVSFDDARGFGFVRAVGLTDDAFLHASEVRGGARPRAGQRASFDLIAGDRGPRAVRVELGRRGLTPGAATAVGLALAAAGLAGALHLALGTGWAGAALGAINLLTFGVYAWDKHRAGRRPAPRRVPEALLIGLAALGGSLGALAGVFALRHKTRKPLFLTALALVILAQAGLAAWWLPRPS